MTDTAFSTIVGRIQPYVSGAPRPLVIEHIRNASIRVCEQTLAWRYMVPLFDLLPGVHEYAFDRPTNADVQHVFAVIVNGQPLDLLNLDEAIRQYPEWADLFSGEDAEEAWSETPGGYVNASAYNDALFNDDSTYVLPDSIVADASTPRACCMISPQKYIILPLPDGERTYETRMFVSLKPTRSAVDMETEAFNEIQDAVIARALNTLLMIPNKLWSNPQLGSYYAGEYQTAWQRLKARANLGHVRGSMSVRMRAWA